MPPSLSSFSRARGGSFPGYVHTDSFPSRPVAVQLFLLLFALLRHLPPFTHFSYIPSTAPPRPAPYPPLPLLLFGLLPRPSPSFLLSFKLALQLTVFLVQLLLNHRLGSFAGTHPLAACLDLASEVAWEVPVLMSGRGWGIWELMEEGGTGRFWVVLVMRVGVVGQAMWFRKVEQGQEEEEETEEEEVELVGRG